MRNSCAIILLLVALAATTPQSVLCADEEVASYRCWDDASWAVWDNKLSDHILGSDRQTLYDNFISKCRTAAGNRATQVCDKDEQFRMQQNMYQPRSCHNFTEVGFKKVRAPKTVWDLIQSFWNQNKGRQTEEWDRPNPYHNIWDTNPSFISVENKDMAGGGPLFRAQIADAARDAMEAWTGMKQAITSVYGIRVYHNNSILAPHVDRMPLVSSAIINVAQDVEEDWPLEVYDHSGIAHNVSLKPGDLVLYESHSVIHGRPFPLRGQYYANIFVHFEPIGPLDATEDIKIIHDNVRYPPYLVKDSSWEPEWREKNPDGWTLLEDTRKLVRDGDLKTIKYVAQIDPAKLQGNEQWTPLHEAVNYGNLEIVRYLVKNQKASITKESTEFGHVTAVDLARRVHGTDHPVTQFLMKEKLFQYIDEKEEETPLQSGSNGSEL